MRYCSARSEPNYNICFILKATLQLEENNLRSVIKIKESDFLVLIHLLVSAFVLQVMLVLCYKKQHCYRRKNLSSVK